MDGHKLNGIENIIWAQLLSYFQLFKILRALVPPFFLQAWSFTQFTVQAVIMIWVCQLTLIAKILYAKGGIVKIPYAKIPIDKIPYAESALCRNSNCQNTLEPQQPPVLKPSTNSSLAIASITGSATSPSYN